MTKKSLPPASHLLQRRVLSVAEYAKEESGEAVVPSKDERFGLYGSTVMPIPVALVPGESEAQYERSLEDWLAAEGKPPINHWRDMPNQERSVRILFAKMRARSFAAGEEIPMRQSPRSPHHGKLQVPKNLGREMALLYTKEFVDIDEYRRDVKDGKFARLAAMSKVERMKLIGSPIVPIVVPLACGESPSQYEARFVEWLKRIHRLTLPKLRSGADDKTLERYYRVQFANASAFGHERFIPPAAGQKREREVVFGDPDDVQPSKKATNATKKSMPILSRVGQPQEASAPSKLTTTPSPDKGCRLQLPSGTAEFHETVAAYAMCACKSCLLNGIQMMTMRLAGVDDSRAKDEQLEVACSSSSSEVPSDQSQHSRSEFTLSMNDDDMQDGETEQSFVEPCEMLADENQSDPQEGASGGNSDILTENTVNVEAQEAVEEPRELVPGFDTSSPPNLPEIAEAPLLLCHVDQPTDDSKDDQLPEHPEHETLESGLDTIEAQLFAQYEMRNNGVMMKEAALNACMARHSGSPPPSLEELTQLHDQNQEIRRKLELQIVERDEALVQLVVYLWRDDVAGLEAIVNESAACDMPPVQRAVHQRCQLLAKTINAHREKITTIKQRGNITSSGGDSDIGGADLLETVERELVELETRRKREIATLLRFDKRLRDAVRRLLETQASVNQ